MGCCQSQLSAPPYPIHKDKNFFIDGIKQDSIQNQQQNEFDKNNVKKKLNKKKSNNQNQPLQQDSNNYQYSIHNIEQDSAQQSQVSILHKNTKKTIISQNNQATKQLIETKSKKKLHVQIHPDIVQKQNEKERQILKKAKREKENYSHNSIIKKQNNQNQNSSKKQMFTDLSNIFVPSLQNFKSGITQNNKNSSNNDLNSNLFLKLQPNKQLQSIKTFQNPSSQNHIFISHPQNSYQTSRQIQLLNNQLNTMIFLWDKIGSTSRLRLQKINQTQQKDEINRQQEQAKSDRQIQQELKDIWGNDKEKDNHNQPLLNNRQQQTSQQNQQQKLQKLKNQFIINNFDKAVNKIEQNNNNQISTGQQLHKHNKQNQFLLKNEKIQQRLSHKKNPSPVSPTVQQKLLKTKEKPLKQQLNLHLSQIVNKNNYEQNNNFSQQDSQNSSQYSKCPLSNPTRYLNESFIQQVNQQKNLFYFGADHKNLQNDNVKSLMRKWQENNRLSYQVKDQHILELLNQENHQHNFLLGTILSVIKKYNQMNAINLIQYKKHIKSQSNYSENALFGFRVFYNGIKRLYPILNKNTTSQQKIHLQLIDLFLSLYKQQKNPSQILYNLTGWISQEIVVEQVKNFQGVFQRLNNNFKDGNTIITFSGKRNVKPQIFWGLKNIDPKKKQIEVYGSQFSQFKNKLIHFNQIKQFQKIFTWEQFIKNISSINVNWNPLIYDFSYKTQNIFVPKDFSNLVSKKDLIQQIDKNYISPNSFQYLLKIPPNQEDIEVRVFLETHYQSINQDDKTIEQPLVLQLYDYNKNRVNSSLASIRKLDKTCMVYSDVLIFQASKEKNQYCLVVRPLDSQKILQKSIKYTLSMYSFFQIGFTQISTQRIIQQKQIVTYLQQSHCGYGINSPHFLDNFYLQLKVPPLQRLKIFVEMPEQACQFQLNLIANPNHEENLTRLNLQNILQNIITSEEFTQTQGKGYLQIQQTKFQQYFFMITNHTKCKGELKIIVQVLQNQAKCLDQQKIKERRNKDSNKSQILNQNKMINCKQKFYYQQPAFIRQFKWSPINSGPRKRLKSNTHSGFQSFVVFKQFFKNPFIDYKFSKKGKYQFSVISDSYTEDFDKLEQIQQKRDIEPPTLSLCILKIKRSIEFTQSQRNLGSQSLFQIVMDDAFYVPFGFGFWTKIMDIQEGQYRFVFPKMQKQGGSGKFSIYQINQS